MVDTGQRVYVIIVNWRNASDTIECLETVCHSDYPNYRVIVCDNASEDDSMDRIKAWADGRVGVEAASDHRLHRLSSPPVPKPIHYVEYDRSSAERGGDPSDEDAKLILIQTGDNLGFAGGNNVGLRYALARDDFDYIWLLNNDTVIEPDALSHLARRMSERPDAGMCGGTLLYYDDPNTVQSLGGAMYSKWLATTRQIVWDRASAHPADVERRMSYVSGACMLVSKPFLKSVGLMSEDYFLYFEEIDWAIRARGRYSLAYSPESIVYHKEGSSIGSGDGVDRSDTSDYYGIRNRIVITRKFFPLALPTVYLGLTGAIINRIRRGQWSRAKMILKLWWSAC